jgi:hypothetical protein
MSCVTNFGKRTCNAPHKSETYLLVILLPENQIGVAFRQGFRICKKFGAQNFLYLVNFATLGLRLLPYFVTDIDFFVLSKF